MHQKCNRINYKLLGWRGRGGMSGSRTVFKRVSGDFLWQTGVVACWKLDHLMKKTGTILRDLHNAGLAGCQHCCICEEIIGWEGRSIKLYNVWFGKWALTWTKKEMNDYYRWVWLVADALRTNQSRIVWFPMTLLPDTCKRRTQSLLVDLLPDK